MKVQYIIIYFSPEVKVLIVFSFLQTSDIEPCDLWLSAYDFLTQGYI